MPFVVVFSALSLRSGGDNIVKFTELETSLERVCRRRRRTIASLRTLTKDARAILRAPETSTATGTPATDARGVDRATDVLENKFASEDDFFLCEPYRRDVAI